MSIKGIFVDRSRVTIVKNRIISKWQQIVRVGEESIEDINPHIMAVTANLAGGLACEIPGVAPVNCEQLKSEMLTL